MSIRVILTHEQSDFDAVASLLGAYLLDESALPVLPRKLNRNVRAFITIYGAELPFVDGRDLPGGGIEQVTLVDTQSLVTLKGMGDTTRVRVVDHHPPRRGLPEGWEVTVTESGSTTTLFVESLLERGEPLSVVRATLLLLGIYEDTGSLTYAHTTARDARAAASLLEGGADLRLAAEFLNPPLSSDQREVYDCLAASAETHYILGHRIVIASGDASRLSEEISALAHKLRDLFDPDALFVLVATQEGIRLVARSTTDQVDVSRVAQAFGGGGHERAAAALIRPAGETGSGEALAQAIRQLLEVLPGIVQPSVTVAQIMSRRPHTIAPETSAQEASRLMARYGYEGFPVVQDGRVTGLLTRRAVDRALSHKMNLPASSLMDAGQVTVAPEDSLQHLQARMTDSGWGQVPVIETHTGKLVGIVTRTDLLKTLSPRRAQKSRCSLAERLEKALPPDRLALVRAVAGEAARQKMAVYLVGGFVRDLLLDKPSLDFDIVVEGDAIALARALSAAFGGRITVHARFGTAKWFLRHSSFTLQAQQVAFLDLISARQEFYDHPSALPSVERGSIKLDLHRRDFTINTLAVRLDGRHFGELLDHWGGLEDLTAGVVRVLHSLSFVDDPTRMLRAVRFEQRFGFQIEARTLHLMGEARGSLEKLSGDRIRHELNLVLSEPLAPSMLARLAQLGLLAAIHPSLAWDDDRSQAVEKALSVPGMTGWPSLPAPGNLSLSLALGYLAWLGRLDEPGLRAVASRLRFSLDLRRLLLALAALLRDLDGLAGKPASAVVRRLEDTPLLAVYAAALLCGKAEARLLKTYASRWRTVQAATDGNILKQRGLPPGPAYQKILTRLRDAWLDGEVTTVEGETALLEELIKAYP
ncbi:MAG: CBS domain-containing protein [Chloroflexi bacterium]|nr:CBS domain-containing protein [Chloroflexota bacterium]